MLRLEKCELLNNIITLKLKRINKYTSISRLVKLVNNKQTTLATKALDWIIVFKFQLSHYWFIIN